MLQLGTVDARYFSAALEFYTTVSGRLLKIKIDIRQPTAHIIVYREETRFGRSGQIVKKYPTNLHEDKQIAWSAGGDMSASATYLWGTESSYDAAMATIVGE
jgi:hypothetical protein